MRMLKAQIVILLATTSFCTLAGLCITGIWWLGVVGLVAGVEAFFLGSVWS